MNNNNISIASLNCRGLGDARKRRDVIDYFKRAECNVVCLQDTHLTAKKEILTKTLWRGRAFFSSFAFNARGVCIPIKDQVDADVEFVQQDDCGNLLAVRLKLEKYSLTVINIYGPNSDDPNFYLELQTLNNRQASGDFVIVCGDFNLVMNQAKDTHNYRREYSQNAKQIIRRIMSENDLTDVWRELNPDKRQFT